MAKSAVDFEFKRIPKIRVAAIERKGRWVEDNLKSEFKELSRWAKSEGVKTGRWIFSWRGERKFEAGLELKGRATPKGRIKLKTLPATMVARVVFDPSKVSPRVIYHGLSDWVKWRKKSKEISGVSYQREVYAGDPWSNAKAWAKTEVQFLVRRPKKS